MFMRPSLGAANAAPGRRLFVEPAHTESTQARRGAQHRSEAANACRRLKIDFGVRRTAQIPGQVPHLLHLYLAQDLGAMVRLQLLQLRLLEQARTQPSSPCAGCCYQRLVWLHGTPNYRLLGRYNECAGPARQESSQRRHPSGWWSADAGRWRRQPGSLQAAIDQAWHVSATSGSKTSKTVVAKKQWSAYTLWQPNCGSNRYFRSAGE